jgi:hypothetical protein
LPGANRDFVESEAFGLGARAHFGFAQEIRSETSKRGASADLKKGRMNPAWRSLGPASELANCAVALSEFSTVRKGL